MTSASARIVQIKPKCSYHQEIIGLWSLVMKQNLKRKETLVIHETKVNLDSESSLNYSKGAHSGPLFKTHSVRPDTSLIQA